MWTMFIAGLSFLYSVFNHVIRNRVQSKLTNNDLKHLTSDVVELKKDYKELKIDLRNDLEKIFRRLGKVEKNQATQTAICEERKKHCKVWCSENKNNKKK